MFKFQEGNVGPSDSTIHFSDIERYRTERYIFKSVNKNIFLTGRPIFADTYFQMVWMAAQEALEVQRSGFLLTFYHLESFIPPLFV